MASIFHILSKQEVEAAKVSGMYCPKSIIDEGFIHCAYLNQVGKVANFLYKGNADLVLLEIDKLRVNCEVIDEDLYGSGELFPHIYGKLPWVSVIATHAFPCNDDGTFELPTTVSV
jgi:uncharacterized protein (DUF952 family)